MPSASSNGYTVKLDTFEGPLDLLLHLVDKEEMDIQNISISSITTQYLAYLQTLRQLDLDVTSDFLVMASSLLAIKARTLLPRPQSISEEEGEQGPDPREELIQRLLEYKQFKGAAQFLEEQQQVQGRVFTRPNSIELYQPWWPIPPLVGLDANRLLTALQRVLERAVTVEPPQLRAAEIRVQDMIAQVLRRLVLYPQGMAFQTIFSRQSSRGEIVVTFLAVLELLHMGQISLLQQAPFADLIIKPAEGEVLGDDVIVS